MVDGWPDIVLRFAVYLDLMVLFGLPLFAACSLGPRAHHGGSLGRRWAALAGGAAVLGAVLSVLALLAMAEQMAGVSDYASVSGHVLRMIVARTGAGLAWAVRAAALVVCIGAAVALRSRPRTRVVVLAAGGAVALATLAWTGHGAMDDGARGALHLAGDVLHLLAAGGWVGALAAFVTVSTARERRDAAGFDMLARTASGFAGVGTVIVSTLVVTGAINYVLVVGPSLGGLVSTLYGRLLAAKLVLFAGMLALAAANRYRLTPRLEAALTRGEPHAAARALRLSLRYEAVLALLVLALVAWIGVLSPDA